MHFLQYSAFAFGTLAIVRAFRVAYGTALVHALTWGSAAWTFWGWAIFSRIVGGPEFQRVPTTHPDPLTYIALCLTCCAGVAVLGARRPGVTAWNFVVLGLLAVMMLPLVETAMIGTRSLDWLRITFLGVTLGISVLNYLPTRFGPAVFLAGLACAAEIVAVAAPQAPPRGSESDALTLCLIAAPALALIRWFPMADVTDDLNNHWLDFRDRWGLVWGQRVREQFNRAAANAGWSVTLSWSGFAFQRPVDAPTRKALRDTLTALLQRFVAVEKK